MKKIKACFATPARATLSLFCLIVLLALLGAGIFLTAGFLAKRSAIGTEQAKALVFADAGIDPASARAVHTEFEFEDGHFVYKVEFLAENIEYEYLIRASDGSILDRDLENFGGAASMEPAVQDTFSVPDTAASPEPADPGTAAPAAPGTTAAEAADSGASGQISLETARQAALSEAGLSDQEVTHTKAELDHDNGILVYEIEFYTAAHDYEYEIDALSGEIRHKEQKIRHGVQNGRRISGAASPSAEGSDIGLEAAQAIAAEHAGLSASEVVFTKAGQEYEDGRLIYEIEFRKDRMEYEYEIDALSGEILKMDYDD